MSNYIEDYMLSTPKEKLETLQTMFNMPGTTKKEKDLILKVAQNLYNQLKGRSY